MNAYVTQPLNDLANALDAAARAVVALEQALQTSQAQGDLFSEPEPEPQQEEAPPAEEPEQTKAEPPMSLQEMSRFLTAVAKKYTSPVLAAALKQAFTGEQKTIDDVAEADRRAFVDRVVAAVKEAQ